MTQHAHRLIAETAKSAAAELYDVVMSNNEVRTAWKAQNEGCGEKELVRRFVKRNWAKCIPVARTTLGLLLRNSTDETLKTQIYEALLLDNTLRRRGGTPLGLTPPQGRA